MRPIGPYTETTYQNHYAPSHTTVILPSGAVYSDVNTTNLLVNGYVHREKFNSGPGWKQLKEQGLLPVTPASLTRVALIDYTPASWVGIYTPTKWTYKYYGGFSIYGLTSLSMMDSIFGAESRTQALSRSKARLIERMRSTEADVAVMIAEGKQTVTLMGDLTKDLLSKTTAFATKASKDILRQRGRLGKAKMTAALVANVASDLWLGYSFGVAPLTNDIASLANALTTDRNLSAKRKKFAASYSRDYATTTVSVSGSEVVHRTFTRHVQSKSGLETLLTPVQYGADASRLGLDWSNVLPAVWEAIPYSFLVDYFTNAGDIISAYSFNPPAYKNPWDILVVHDTVATTSTPLQSDGIKRNGHGYSHTEEYFSWNRSAASSIYPSLGLTSNWDTLSRLQKVNIGALAVSRLSKSGLDHFRRLKQPEVYSSPTFQRFSHKMNPLRESFGGLDLPFSPL